MKKHKLKLPLTLSSDISLGCTYVVKDSNGKCVSDNMPYENYAFEEQNIGYIVQAANLFPEAIELLKSIIEEIRTGNFTRTITDINQFLTKLNEE